MEPSFGSSTCVTQGHHDREGLQNLFESLPQKGALQKGIKKQTFRYTSAGKACIDSKRELGLEKGVMTAAT